MISFFRTNSEGHWYKNNKNLLFKCVGRIKFLSIGKIFKKQKTFQDRQRAPLKHSRRIENTVLLTMGLLTCGTFDIDTIPHIDSGHA